MEKKQKSKVVKSKEATPPKEVDLKKILTKKGYNLYEKKG